MKTAMLRLRTCLFTPFWKGKSSEPNPWFSGSTCWSSGGWKSKIYAFTISTPMSPWQQPPRGTRTWISRIVLAWTGGQVSCHFSKSQEMQPLHPKQTKLVGGWTNPFEKYARQIGSFPLVGVKMKKNIWTHHPATKMDVFWGASKRLEPCAYFSGWWASMKNYHSLCSHKFPEQSHACVVNFFI